MLPKSQRKTFTLWSFWSCLQKSADKNITNVSASVVVLDDPNQVEHINNTAANDVLSAALYRDGHNKEMIWHKVRCCLFYVTVIEILYKRILQTRVVEVTLLDDDLGQSENIFLTSTGLYTLC